MPLKSKDLHYFITKGGVKLIHDSMQNISGNEEETATMEEIKEGYINWLTTTPTE